MRGTADVCGLVLAGGRSERMGSDKGLLNIHGETMREYLLGQLRRVCTRAYTSCRLGQLVPLWMDPIIDGSFTTGPLNGLLSAFHHNPACAWLAVAVDMPYVDAKVLGTLIKERDPGALATCYYNEQTARPEPLLTLWEPAAFPKLKDFVAQGRSSVRDFLSGNSVHLLFPPSARVFRSLNDPDDILELTEVSDGRLRLK